MATIPNRSQTERIASDLRKLSQGETPRDWQGNSYSGRYIRDYDSGEYRYILRHWQTDIAQFTVRGGAVRLVEFRARYYSTTTRSFQGRILSAMGHAATDPVAQSHIHWELSRPTGERQTVTGGE